MPYSAANLFSRYRSPTYTVGLAGTAQDVFLCQQLSDQILAQSQLSQRFAEDNQGAYYRHILVKDNTSKKLAATARILFKRVITDTIRYDCETKFDIANLLALPGRLMEVGRISIHPDFHTTQVVSTLWQGLASLIAIHKIDYLFSVLEIPTDSGGEYAAMVTNYVKQHHFAPGFLRVFPKSKFPTLDSPNNIHAVLPPGALKTYLRYGAVVCGDPYWNSGDRIAEMLIFLDRSSVTQRYKKTLLEHI